MNLRLENKVVLVSGASQGIGHAIGLAFAREGCRVIINARDEEKLNAAVEEAAGDGGEVVGIPGDVTSADDVQRLVEKTLSRFSRIDVLVNNVGGIGSFAPFHELFDEDWRQVMELNLLSTVRLIREVLPHMREQQSGRIINIASESGIQPDPVMPHYNAAKAAIINLTKSLSKACAGDGVLVNAVSPAFVKTPLIEKMLADQARDKGVSEQEAEAQFLRDHRPHLVLNRAGRAEEVAAVVVFLGSEAASFVTGANYRVDGGSIASMEM